MSANFGKNVEFMGTKEYRFLGIQVKENFDVSLETSKFTLYFSGSCEISYYCHYTHWHKPFSREFTDLTSITATAGNV
jgi:hypothetical protein